MHTEGKSWFQYSSDFVLSCKREWKGAFQFRNRWSRHFCSLCLRTYCFEHTHFSPHGAFGYCGQHSQCVCVSCFRKQSPERQRFLESINRLDKTASKKAELEKRLLSKRKEFFISIDAWNEEDKQ